MTRLTLTATGSGDEITTSREFFWRFFGAVVLFRYCFQLPLAIQSCTNMIEELCAFCRSGKHDTARNPPEDRVQDLCGGEAWVNGCLFLF